MKFQFVYPILIFTIAGINYVRIRIGHALSSKERKVSLNEFYTKTFPFYNMLNEKEKKKFILRSYLISQNKTIKIDPEIEHQRENIEKLIAAAITQITFGYRSYQLETFPLISISKSYFYSRLVKAEVKGLTLGNGKILYSWEDFLHGYLHSDDRLNLALHELAHAIYIERFHGTEQPIWIDWKTQAKWVMQNPDPSCKLLRPYGFTNISEFWAINVETFFEDPINFRQKYPRLYSCTAKILKQDMAERKMISAFYKT